MQKVYLDFNASTSIAPEVIDAMRPYLADHYGNPSSQHWAGAPAKDAVENARLQVAGLLGCCREEIVFTSGGTEANNTAIKGVFHQLRERGNHIITTQIEHPATVQPCRFLEKLGAEVTYLPVDRDGIVDPDDVRAAITDETILVTVIHANNEVGTIQPIAEIGRITREAGVLFHTDAAQSVGKIPTNVTELGIDFLSVAGHKAYAPKGVGALYIRHDVEIEPFVHGAGHEGGRRAGTENVLLDVALGAACEVSKDWIGMPQVRELRDRFWHMLQETFGDGVVLNGHHEQRLPNTLNVSFVGKVGSEILAGLQGVAASTGSACHEGIVELSPVLEAMAIPPEIGMDTIRFSLGRTSTAAEIEYVVERLKQAVRSDC
jgi:cysteine desulfurase